ncbi:hypothetical protein LEP1GSC041_1455 [Leptospira noguchii str. 2006001870]|uniref:hypothetical protein n=1 Tax=Leptospira noguchii TaxID=28182 RepID=UPI000248B1B5|nr:hypothetical protein [Leptospira noguchii]EKR73085.1 hypothetical protein LEP1GSC041_1455 [Leptospira noguchii str. 2006001870]
MSAQTLIKSQDTSDFYDINNTFDDKVLYSAQKNSFQSRVVEIKDRNQYFNEFKHSLFKTLVKNFLKEFNQDEYSKNYFVKIIATFNNVCASIYSMKIVNIYAHITDVDSVYFRIFLPKNCEIHLEIFYNNSMEKDSLEAIASIYNNDSTSKNIYGSLKNVLIEIKRLTSSNVLLWKNTL